MSGCNISESTASIRLAKKTQLYMIDAVLTWVDGNDPALKAVKTSYLTGRK
ncbi:MAG: Stealth CR1 domain-containing protein, partial [Bacteroidales bacterium]|nr:Stealth CR1 domain-containing protein [Bacteroidales bacterium]